MKNNESVNIQPQDGEPNKGKLVMVTTEYRGVFVGTIEQDNAPDLVILKDARNVIYWHSQVEGVFGLASKGPSSLCRIGPKVERLRTYKVTSVTDVSDEAAKVWEARK